MERKNSARLTVEQLESRELPASHFVLGGGLLRVQGTMAADRLRITAAGAGRVRVALSGGFNEVHTYGIGQVRRITFRALAGPDRFVNRTGIASEAYGARGNDVLIGNGGNDRLVG